MGNLWNVLEAADADARQAFAAVAGGSQASVDPSWLTSTVRALAEGTYREKAFDRLPVLADALMDAGCDNDEVLNHCRTDGPHVRGCWVVEMLTGRT